MLGTMINCYILSNLLIKIRHILCIFVEMPMCRAAAAQLALASRRPLSFLPPSLDADLTSFVIPGNLARIASEPNNVSNVSYDVTKTSQRFVRFLPTGQVT